MSKKNHLQLLDASFLLEETLPYINKTQGGCCNQHITRKEASPTQKKSNIFKKLCHSDNLRLLSALDFISLNSAALPFVQKGGGGAWIHLARWSFERWKGAAMESLLHLLEAPDSLTFAPLSKASQFGGGSYIGSSSRWFLSKCGGLELEEMESTRICGDSGGCLLVFMACGFGDYMIRAGWLNVFFCWFCFCVADFWETLGGRV